MADITLKIDPEELGALTQKAIVDSLSDEAKERLLAQAVRWMTEPMGRNSIWTNKPSSPLQDAFYQAINISMQTLVREWFEEDKEVKGKVMDHLRDVLVPFLDHLTGEDKDELTKVVMTAVIDYIALQKVKEHRY